VACSRENFTFLTPQRTHSVFVTKTNRQGCLVKLSALVARIIRYTQIHCTANCTVSYCYNRWYIYLPLLLKRFVVLLVLTAFSLLRRDNCCISHDDTCTEGVSRRRPPPKPPSITLEHVVERSLPPPPPMDWVSVHGLQRFLCTSGDCGTTKRKSTFASVIAKNWKIKSHSFFGIMKLHFA
jgi:hypothetical protein